MLVINLSLRNVLILVLLVAIPGVMIYSLITAKNPKTMYGKLINSVLKQIVGV
jgi:hypothetical protein